MNDHPPMLYHNRELSWLTFNQRVLEQAADVRIPLLERLRFLAIYCNNLDEFFMIRVGTLTDAMLLQPDAVDNKSGMNPAQQLDAIFDRIRALSQTMQSVYQGLMADLACEQLGVVHANELTEQQWAYLDAYFKSEVQPMLSPQIIDKHHPFPFLKNKEIYICARLKTKGAFIRLAIIPLSSSFDRLVSLPDSPACYALMEDLVLRHCEEIFHSYEVLDKTVFRITRNADINVDEAFYDHDMDYRSVMEEMVKKRRKLMPVRIEFQNGVSGAVVEQLCKKLELSTDRVFRSRIPLDPTFGFSLCAQLERMGMQQFFYTPLIPQNSPNITTDRPIIPQIEDHDVLLSYPYESMRPLIELLREASEDKNVISIKMTLYRVARESSFIAALIKAAENGKDVHVVVELRARFDEENNIIWSKRLEEAGANVVYGLGEYKVHSKLLLITRKTGTGFSFITQVGTGNYNESTARQYTDLCLLTANRTFGEDAQRIFSGILTDHPAGDTKCLLAAPHDLKPAMLRYIAKEARLAAQGEEAQIIIKINSLTDKEIIDALIAASQAGVRIRMLIRGICCLRAGLPGYTDNIEVISIVGRFLEHSRIYVFGPPQRCHMYISSADFMTRNTERRVEVAAPIYSSAIKKEILHMLEVQFTDNVKARRLLENGEYEPVVNEHPPTDSQIDLYKLAYENAREQEQTLATPAGVSARRIPVISALKGVWKWLEK